MVEWTVRGYIKLRHNDGTISNMYPSVVSLENVEVRISAREKIMGVWGPYNSWGTVRTNDKGFFSISKDKDKSKRQFKVEVLFKDDQLKIYPENEGFINDVIEGVSKLVGSGAFVQDAAEKILEQTSRIAFDVKWYTVYKEDKDDKSHSSGTAVGLESLIFGDGKEDLNDAIAIKHALVWFVFKKVFKFMKDLKNGVAFDEKKPVALKYPHSLPIIEKQESSYSNPYNDTIFIIRNSRTDHLNVDTILHELMHIWAYQHSRHEKALAWQLFVHGSTHSDLTAKSFVAFHEGFAEWASNRLTKFLFGVDSTIYGDTVDNGTPFSKYFLKSKKVSNLKDVDKSEYAWMSLFNMLMTPDLHLYDFGGSGDYATSMSASSVAVPAGSVCSSPGLKFEEILKVFCEKPDACLDKELNKDEMNLDDFLGRVNRYYPDKVTSRQVEAIKALLDPSNTKSAADLLCYTPDKPRRKMP